MDSIESYIKSRLSSSNKLYIMEGLEYSIINEKLRPMAVDSNIEYIECEKFGKATTKSSLDEWKQGILNGLTSTKYTKQLQQFVERAYSDKITNDTIFVSIISNINYIVKNLLSGIIKKINNGETGIRLLIVVDKLSEVDATILGALVNLGVNIVVICGSTVNLKRLEGLVGIESIRYDGSIPITDTKESLSIGAIEYNSHGDSTTAISRMNISAGFPSIETLVNETGDSGVNIAFIGYTIPNDYNSFIDGVKTISGHKESRVAFITDRQVTFKQSKLFELKEIPDRNDKFTRMMLCNYAEELGKKFGIPEDLKSLAGSQFDYFRGSGKSLSAAKQKVIANLINLESFMEPGKSLYVIEGDLINSRDDLVECLYNLRSISLIAVSCIDNNTIDNQFGVNEIVRFPDTGDITNEIGAVSTSAYRVKDTVKTRVAELLDKPNEISIEPIHFRCTDEEVSRYLNKEANLRVGYQENNGILSIPTILKIYKGNIDEKSLNELYSMATCVDSIYDTVIDWGILNKYVLNIERLFKSIVNYNEQTINNEVLFNRLTKQRLISLNIGEKELSRVVNIAVKVSNQLSQFTGDGWSSLVDFRGIKIPWVNFIMIISLSLDLRISPAFEYITSGESRVPCVMYSVKDDIDCDTLLAERVGLLILRCIGFDIIIMSKDRVYTLENILPDNMYEITDGSLASGKDVSYPSNENRLRNQRENRKKLFGIF